LSVRDQESGAPHERRGDGEVVGAAGGDDGRGRRWQHTHVRAKRGR
jgi:hypothetical protein